MTINETNEEFVQKFCKHLQSAYNSLKKAEEMNADHSSITNYDQWEKVGRACDAILNSAEYIRLSSERAMGRLYDAHHEQGAKEMHEWLSDNSISLRQSGGSK
jgi:hypothetical protein